MNVDMMHVTKVKLGSDHPGALPFWIHLEQQRLRDGEKLTMDVMNIANQRLADHPETLKMLR